MRKLRDSLFIWLIEHDMVFLVKFYSDLIRVVTFPRRLFRLKDFLRERERQAQQFQVGEWVRLKPPRSNTPAIVIGPGAQQHFDQYDLGREVQGGRIWKERKVGPGSATYSFFDARDPWKIIKIEISDLERDAEYYLRGIGITHRCTLTLENSEVAFGKKTIPQIPAEIVVKVLPDLS